MSEHPAYGPISATDLRKLADAPLDNGERASKVWVPLGKRPIARGPTPVYECEFAPAATSKEVRTRRDEQKDKKLGEVLNYYAKTDIPFDRIAAHTKLDMVTVIRVMKLRGRMS